MPISFASLSGGASNDVGFVINVGSSVHYTTTFEDAFPAGAYSISISQSDTTWDIYGIGANDAFAGYSSGSKITFTIPVEKIVIFGSVANQIYTFAYDGPTEAPETSGDITGAAAYITGISTTRLQNLNSTVTITGGNFASNVEVWFDESGLSSVPAKSVTRNSSTQIVATRPDSIAFFPIVWDVRVVNPGIPMPTVTNSHVLPNAIDFGISVPTSIQYSVIGSGGGGGSYGGGGGGGKVVNGSFTPAIGTAYTISCAAGGGGSFSEFSSGGSGSTTNFNLSNTIISAAGGGGGGSVRTNGLSASGGGGGASFNFRADPQVAGSFGNSNTGSGRGGNAYLTTFTANSGGMAFGGGGGSTGNGGDAVGPNGNAGNGGSGTLTASGEFWGGGGGGGASWGTGTNYASFARSPGAGIHGGGNGGSSSQDRTPAGNGEFGGGGGGGHYFTPNGDNQGGAWYGGNGGNGAVILKYSNEFSTITTIGAGLTYTLTNSGGYRIYKFTAGTGTITW